MAVSFKAVFLTACIAITVNTIGGFSYFKLEAHTEYLRRMSAAKTNSTGGRTCYGDVMTLRPTGKSTTGVPGSRSIAQADTPELKKRWSYYQTVADKNCIQASLIAALASRESNGGADLYSTGGWGDHHRAWGILQCDVQHSGLDCLACDWDSYCHIEMLVSQLLLPYIQKVHQRLPSWSVDQALQGGVAAYNCGVGRIKSWQGVDQFTTGHDYSNDVIARAQYLYQKGWN